MAKNIIVNDLERLARGEFRKLSAGLTPSGKLHIGTLVTLMNGLLYMKDHDEATLDVTIHDLYANFQMGLSFLPAKYREDPDGCHAQRREHTKEELETFFEGMAEYLGIDASRINIGYMSDILAQPNTRKKISEVLGDNRKRYALKQIIKSDGKGNHKVPLHPVCGSCRHASTEYARYKPKTDELEATCNTKGCEQEGRSFKVRISDTSLEIVPYYLINLIRDVIPHQRKDRADLHLSGGDKLERRGTKYGREVPTIAERGLYIMEVFSKALPTLYIGPTVTYRGTKLSKRQHSRFTFAKLAERYENWQEQLLAFTLEAAKQPEYDIRQSNLKDMLKDAA